MPANLQMIYFCTNQTLPKGCVSRNVARRKAKGVDIWLQPRRISNNSRNQIYYKMTTAFMSGMFYLAYIFKEIIYKFYYSTFPQKYFIRNFHRTFGSGILFCFVTRWIPLFEAGQIIFQKYSLVCIKFLKNIFCNILHNFRISVIFIPNGKTETKYFTTTTH